MFNILPKTRYFEIVMAVVIVLAVAAMTLVPALSAEASTYQQTGCCDLDNDKPLLGAVAGGVVGGTAGAVGAALIPTPLDVVSDVTLGSAGYLAGHSTVAFLSALYYATPLPYFVFPITTFVVTFLANASAGIVGALVGLVTSEVVDVTVGAASGAVIGSVAGAAGALVD